MANLTPLSQFYSIERASTNSTDATISGFDIFGVLPLSNSGAAQYIDSNIVTNYDADLDDEICYFVTGRTTSNFIQLWAVRANGPKTGIIIDEASVLWRTTLTGSTSSRYQSWVTLSDDGERAYISTNSFFAWVFCVDTTDGSLLWSSASHGDFGSQNTYRIETPPMVDNNGFVWVFAYRNIYGNNPDDHYAYRQKFHPDTGARQLGWPTMRFLESLIIQNGSDLIKWAPGIAQNASKDRLYGVYARLGNANQTNVIEFNTTTNGYSFFSLKDELGQDFGNAPSGISYVQKESANIVYVPTNEYGLYKINFPLGLQWRQSLRTSNAYSHPSLPSTEDNIIYYRDGSRFYRVRDNGGASAPTLLSTISILPSESNLPSYQANVSMAGVVADSDQKLLYIASSVQGNTTDNFHVYDVDGSGNFSFVNSYVFSPTTTAYINKQPVVGDNQLCYLAIRETSGPHTGYLYILRSVTPPTTTTTTTTSPITTTTTTTPTTTTTTTGTGTTTTTSTTTPTTTTTTTTPAPLAIVITEFFEIEDGEIVAADTSTASDNEQTQDTPFAASMSFGTIAPGQTSKTVIVGLNIPTVSAIQNVKIALVDTGGIEFANGIFGVEAFTELRGDLEPTTYFQGVNEDDSELNVYNVEVPTRTNIASTYVYLNVTLPQDHTLGTGVIRYKWYFDYSE